MTITDFLSRCETLVHDGILFELAYGAITSVDGEHCPINEVFYRSDHDAEWGDVDENGRALGLRRRDIGSITRAADSIEDTRLRRRLLAACGCGGTQ